MIILCALIVIAIVRSNRVSWEIQIFNEGIDAKKIYISENKLSFKDLFT